MAAKEAGGDASGLAVGATAQGRGRPAGERARLARLDARALPSRSGVSGSSPVRSTQGPGAASGTGGDTGAAAALHFGSRGGSGLVRSTQSMRDPKGPQSERGLFPYATTRLSGFALFQQAVTRARCLSCCLGVCQAGRGPPAGHTCANCRGAPNLAFKFNSLLFFLCRACFCPRYNDANEDFCARTFRRCLGTPWGFGGF